MNTVLKTSMVSNGDSVVLQRLTHDTGKSLALILYRVSKEWVAHFWALADIGNSTVKK